MNGHVNTQNNRYWSTENPFLQHEIPLHKVIVGVWCALSKRRIIGSIFFMGTVNSDRCVGQIMQLFFTRLTNKGKVYGQFQQDSTTAHTATHSMHALREVFNDRVISHGLWLPCSPDNNPHDFFVRGYLEDKVNATNPHTSEELKEDILFLVFKISREVTACELKHVLTGEQNA
jgi:hypothetical protein